MQRQPGRYHGLTEHMRCPGRTRSCARRSPGGVRHELAAAILETYATRASVRHKGFLAENDIPPSGRFSFKDLRAVFIRDPDRNVIELDAYAKEEPETRSGSSGSTGYQAHP